MKVLHTLDSLNRGGAETLALDVCRNAKRFGVDLTFVATGGGILEEDFENAGAEYIRLQRDFPIDLNLAYQLRKIIKERDIKIVHGYQPVECLHLYLASIGLKDVKCIMSHQGGGLFLNKRKNRITVKLLAPLVDANVACSRGIFPWLREKLDLNTSKNFYLIHNAVDERKILAGKSFLKKELGLDEDSLLFGMTANFLSSATKDQMTICRALPKVFEEFDNANFVFIGKIAEDGEDYFNRCVEFCDDNGIGKRVFFLGGRDDIPDILASLDLFVFSSLHEGLPIAVIEAMFAKTPIIVSDIPPLLEITNEGKNAETFQVKNDRELSEKIIKLAKDEKLKQTLVENAYQFAQQNFSMKAHFSHLIRLYQDLLDQD